jgi:hypothetical protein
MKKSILVLAFAGIFGLASFAQESEKQHDQMQQQTQENRDKKDKDFKSVSVDNVPDAVERAVRQSNRNARIESAEHKTLENGQTVYKVKLAGVEDGEDTQMFYADGREFDEAEERNVRQPQSHQDELQQEGIQGRDNEDDNNENRNTRTP